MTVRAVSKAAAPAAAFFLAGCVGAGASDDSGPPLAPNTPVFEGKVDPKFAGTWKTKDGNSSLQLGKDGALKVETISNSQSGKSDVKVSGQWLVKDKHLTLRYSGKSNEPEVIQYTATLSGNSLTLELGRGRLKTTYRR